MTRVAKLGLKVDTAFTRENIIGLLYFLRQLSLLNHPLRARLKLRARKGH